jgi:hypothetical protein
VNVPAVNAFDTPAGRVVVFDLGDDDAGFYVASLMAGDQPVRTLSQGTDCSAVLRAAQMCEAASNICR